MIKGSRQCDRVPGRARGRTTAGAAVDRGLRRAANVPTGGHAGARSVRRWLGLAVLLALTVVTGCDDIMDQDVQPSYQPLEQTDLFPSESSAQPLPQGTVPAMTERQWRLRQAGHDPASPLMRIDNKAEARALIRYGQVRYNTWCTPCHAIDGYGRGMVVQRGYPQAQSLHTDRLRKMSDAHMDRVIVNGLGKMPPYGDHLSDLDRKAIIAYIRVLQLSQHADLAQLPPRTRARALQSLTGRGGGGGERGAGDER